MGFDSLDAALRMRDMIVSAAEGAVGRMRPEPRIGTVKVINTLDYTCEVLFPGETNTILVKCDKNLMPAAVNDLVRVAKYLGKYIVIGLVSAKDASVVALESRPTVITGEIKMWPTATLPAGYLFCTGGTFLSTDYPNLATLLGDTYGTHSGTTYYLPDFRGRSPLGPGIVSPDQGNGYVFSLGQKYGEQRHIISVAEMPSHQHAAPYTASGWHAWTITGAGGAAYLVQSGGNVNVTDGAAGGSGSHENMHPILGVNFIIKT